MGDAPVFSRRSLLSLAAIERTPVVSSQQVGWTSLLAEQHVVAVDSQLVDLPPTPDLKLVVGVAGAQLLEVRSPTGWRSSDYRAGTVGVTAGGRSEVLRRRRAAPSPTFEKINLYVPAATVQQVVERAGARCPSEVFSAPRSAGTDQIIALTARAVVQAVTRGVPDLYAESAALWLVTHLVLGAGATTGPGRNVLRESRLGAVLDLIHEEFAHPLSLDRLATEARVSKFHFSRLFRQATGLTVHRYVVQVRLEAARTLLQETELGVAQVASRCGYGSPSHFAAAFTARFGMSPSDVRDAHGPTGTHGNRSGRRAGRDVVGIEHDADEGVLGDGEDERVEGLPTQKVQRVLVDRRGQHPALEQG